MRLISLFLFFLAYIKSISIVANRKKNLYCVYKILEEIETLHLSYVITGGYGEDKCNVALMSPTDNLIYSQENSNKGEFIYHKGTAGQYTLCFKKLTIPKMIIHLNFYTHSEIGFFHELAQDSKRFFKMFFREYNRSAYRYK